MANVVEQRVRLDGREYRRGVRDIANESKSATRSVRKDFDETGDAAKDFAARGNREFGSLKKGFADLAKGFKVGLGAFGAIQLGQAVGGGIAAEASQALDFSKIMDRLSNTLGLNQEQEAAFRKQILAISDSTNVEEENIAAAAEQAAGFVRTGKELADFSEVIARASKVLGDETKARELSTAVVERLRSRGQDVTGRGAENLINALIAGQRTGQRDLQEVLRSLEGVSSDVQQRAGLDDRQLVNLFSGAVQARGTREGNRAAITELINLTTEDLGRQEIFQGLGVDFRDQQGKFRITAQELDKAASRLSQVGGRREQQALLQSAGLSQQGATGLLNIIQDRQRFTQGQRAAREQDLGLQGAFERSTESFSEQASGFFNRIGNFFKSDDLRGQGPSAGFDIPKRQRPAEDVLQQTALTGGVPEAQQRVTKSGDKTQVEVTTKVEIEKVPEGFTAKPSLSSLNRDPGEF